MTVKKWAMVVFMVGILCVICATRLHAAVAVYQCEAYCGHICGCTGQIAGGGDCCGVCYNKDAQPGGGWVACCGGGACEN